VAGSVSHHARWVVLVASLGAGAVAAQQDGPAGLALDPFMVYPGVDLGFGYDDNLFQSEINKRSSGLMTFSPSLRIEGRPGPHRFDASASYSAGRYSRSSEDDYDDYRLDASGQVVFSSRADLGLRVQHVYTHEARGSTDRPASNSPDEYSETGGEGTFGYGSHGARGRAEVNAGSYSRKYHTNRVVTQASDRDTAFVGATFFWRVAPKTQLLLQAEERPIDYDLESSTLDSDETRFYAGARWDATAATSGIAKVGRLKKDFRSAGREDFTTSSWDVGVQWRPLSYSVFDLVTTRQTNESTGVGDTTVTTRYVLTWTHNWNTRLRSQALAGWSNDDFRGVGVTREDDTGTLGLRLHYQFRRWLRFGAEYTYSDRDSSDPLLSYQRNVILLTVGATL
jgi:polysaccharide biosynthesis protein VpsM